MDRVKWGGENVVRVEKHRVCIVSSPKASQLGHFQNALSIHFKNEEIQHLSFPVPFFQKNSNPAESPLHKTVYTAIDYQNPIPQRKVIHNRGTHSRPRGGVKETAFSTEMANSTSPPTPNDNPLFSFGVNRFIAYRCPTAAACFESPISNWF
ncbi:hypothetical protein TNCV_1661511 [Trichonephila clavipes]|nr:hypothetical protein TNCV_1661511 [Trichonephila clavipes]